MTPFAPSLRHRVAVLAACALGLSASAFAQGTAWPQKPITLVVGYPAGGSTDQLARAIQKPMQDFLKQPVIV